jgi:hypothetical protein
MTEEIKQTTDKEKQTAYWQKRTLQALPETRAAKAAGLFPKKEGWRNVEEHMLVAAEAADVLAELLDLPKHERNDLYKAALLHDIGKRKQKGLIDKKGEEGIEEAALWRSSFIRDRGYSEKVIQLTKMTGHRSLVRLLKNPKAEQLELKEDIDLATLILHYVDDITMNSRIVTVDERMDALESRQPPYPEAGKGREIFNRTYYQVQRIVAHLIEEKFVARLGIEKADEIPDLIREKINERIADIH